LDESISIFAVLPSKLNLDNRRIDEAAWSGQVETDPEARNYG